VEAPANAVLYLPTANPNDNQAIGYLYGAASNPQILSSVLDPTLVDQLTGRPLYMHGIDHPVVSTGGPSANKLTNYYEDSRMAALRASVTAYPGAVGFVLRDGTTIPGAKIPWETDFSHNDLFLVELFIDDFGNMVMIVYGITHLGTLAGGTYVHEVILQHPGLYQYSWGIYRSTDSPEKPDSIPQRNEISLVFSEDMLPIPVID